MTHTLEMQRSAIYCSLNIVNILLLHTVAQIVKSAYKNLTKV